MHNKILTFVFQNKTIGFKVTKLKESMEEKQQCNDNDRSGPAL